jgi:hypothetical protein
LMLQTVFPERLHATDREWVEHFVGLGKNLSVKVEMPELRELQAAS